MLMVKMAGTGCVSVLSVAAVPPAAPLDALFMRVGSRQTNKSRLVHACSSSPVTQPLVSDSLQYVLFFLYGNLPLTFVPLLWVVCCFGWPACTDTFNKFNKFLNKDGKWKESITKDTRGILSLYEAATKDEKISMEFTRFHLTQLMPFMAPQSRRCIAQALELPRHLRMARLEARKYIDEYRREWNHNLAQSLHQRELLDLVGKLGFGRDRPLECFLWTVGIFPEPHYSGCRIELTKTIAILMTVDDIFDTYGSLSDLVLFANAIQRWDLDAMEQIPEYMKICYMALYNTTNEISFSQLAEAKWFNKGYVPNLEEYLANGVTTVGTYMALVHAFFLMGQGVTRESSVTIEPYPKLFSCAGKILRLWDDLGTARISYIEKNRIKRINNLKRVRTEYNLATYLTGLTR
ncbi:hypothetical protein ACOSQ2_009344 [Xanthoceras sorbifolium]